MILVKILRLLKVIKKINEHAPLHPCSPSRESDKEGVLETSQFSCCAIPIPFLLIRKESKLYLTMSTDRFFSVKSPQTNQNRSKYCCQEKMKEPTKLIEARRNKKFKSNTVLLPDPLLKEWLLFLRKGGNMQRNDLGHIQFY